MQSLVERGRRTRCHAPDTRRLLRILTAIGILVPLFLILTGILASGVQADEPPATISSDGVPPQQTVSPDGVTTLYLHSGRVDTTIDGVEMSCWPIDHPVDGYDRLAIDEHQQLYGCSTVGHATQTKLIVLGILLLVVVVCFVAVAVRVSSSKGDATGKDKPGYKADPS